jgi:hypothetical protein
VAARARARAARAFAAASTGPKASTTAAYRAWHTEFDAELRDWVSKHGAIRQRDAAWFAAMGTTVGGSEIGALFGVNTNASETDVVIEKVLHRLGKSSWNPEGKEACHWGTLFEDVIGRYTELDLGAPLRGDEICIQLFRGHRNSPDGYIVARCYTGADGRNYLWTTNMPEQVPVVPRTLLIEFKCPFSRKPRGPVPATYEHQVQSGLSVSPLATSGLFVDAVFRKCGFYDWGPSPAYDRGYHSRDAHRGDHASGVFPSATTVAVEWEQAPPVAIGLIGVYAPRPTARMSVRLGWRGEAWAEGDPTGDGPDDDAAAAALDIRAQCGTRGSAVDNSEPADLGVAGWHTFNRALRLIDAKRFRVKRLDPCFTDGRRAAPVSWLAADSADLHAWGGRYADDPDAAIAAMAAEAPADWYLAAVLPWKLFSVSYQPIERRTCFVAEMVRRCARVHERVEEALTKPDPVRHVVDTMPGRRRTAAAEADDGSAVGITAADVDELFATVGAGTLFRASAGTLFRASAGLSELAPAPAAIGGDLDWEAVVAASEGGPQ